MSTFWLFLALLVICCSYALLRGGACERLTAGLYLLAYAVGFLLPRLDTPGAATTVAAGFYSLDAALLVALTAVAVNASRFWPLYLAGFQGAAVIAHTAKLLDPSMMGFGCALQIRGWAYPMLIVLAVGTWRHRERLRRAGSDPSWKSASRKADLP